MNFDKAYVIGSYDFSPKRLKRFYHMSNSMNINVELWPAIYGLDVDVNEYKANGYLSDDFELRMPGSLGCLLSHVTLWEHCQKDSNCKIALILEDDVTLNSNFIDSIHKLSLEGIPENWAIIKLSYNRVIGSEFSKSFIKPELNLGKGINAGSWCYLINTSFIGDVKKVLIPYNNKVSMDVIVRSNIDKINIFFTKEKLATHDQIRYSVRKDINRPNVNIFKKIITKLSKKFYS